MNKRNASKHFLLVLLVLLVALSLTSVASAQQGSTKKPYRGEITVTEATNIAGRAVRLPDGRIQVIVTLSADPAVTAFINNGGRSNNASARSAAVNQQAAVRQEQAAFAAQVSSLGATVARSTSYIVNTVTVQINPNQVVALSRLPGVQRVDADLVVARDDTVSVPFMGADDAWTDGTGTGFTGAGTVIAVIDSGTDYIHTDFGGSGDYADNPDTTDGGDSDFFPADFPIVAAGDPKVIGGTDYVGDDFDSTGDAGSPVPAPDGDPIDCAIESGGGHGTHVSGTAAGWGVNADGTTYAGPFDNTIYTSFPAWTEAFRIGPGVAPEAALVALRVFGCNGSTSTAIIISAIDDAVSGATAGEVQADVINMSLGSAYGYQDPNSPDNVAIKNASDAGTAVVMSAGNNGDFFFITGSPGQANEGIAVASAVDPGNQARGIELNVITPPSDTVFAAAYGAGSPFIHEPVTAVFERPAPDPSGCTAADYAGFTPGNIALIDRGGACGFAVKQDVAFLAGASGVVVANIASSANPGTLVTMVAPTNPEYDIPTVHVNLASGDALRAAADGTNTITMDWTLAAFLVEPADTLSSFSSRGPSRSSLGSFKPDLAAPGNSILSAGSGTGEFTYNISGTSMASPHIAGAMALLREKYPDWSVAELKALIMNTSTNPVTNGVNAYGPQRIGSGRADLADTFAAGEVIAYDAGNPAGVSVNFGALEIPAGDTLTAIKSIMLENLTATQVDYNVSFVQGTNMVGITITPGAATVSVPANGTATVDVTVAGDPNVAGVNTNSDPTLATANRHYLTEESGYIVFTPTAGSTQPLQVGVYAAPRVNSEMTATDTIDIDTVSGSTTVDLAGNDVATGETSNDIVSLVSAFELVATSPNEENTPDNADLAYTGIYSDYPIAAEGEGWVYFAFASHGDWNSLNEVGFQVLLDYDFDGVADFAIFNDSATGLFDTFTVEFTDLNGVFGPAGAVYGYNTLPNGFAGDLVNTYALNNNVIFLPIPMEDLLNVSLEVGPEFDYWIETYSVRFEDPETEELLLVDSLGSSEEPFSYNPETPAYQFTGSPFAPIFEDADAGTIGVDYDFSAIVPNPVPDILLLHHHNTRETGRAEVVDITVPVPGDFTLVSPADGTVLDTVEDIEAFTTVTWTEAADALTYTFELTKPDESVVELAGLTPAASDDALTCDAGTCTLTVADPLSLIDQNGAYEWAVYALSELGMTGATNNPFTFTVDVPVPGDFTLLSPANGAVFTDPASVTTITWSESANAATYDFLLLKLSGNADPSALTTRIDTGEILELNDLTPEADTDALTCAAGTCTLTVDALTQAELTDGTYAWTAFGDNGFAETEASNAAFLFKVNTGDIELLVNGDFELAGEKESEAASWTIKNKSGDKRKVDGAQSNSGIAYFAFKGKPGENAKVSQKASDNAAFTNVGVVAGDVLTAQVFVNTEVATAGKLTVKIKYEDPTAGTNANGKDKIVVNLIATTGYQAFTGTITVDDTVTKLVYIVGFTSPSGKMLVDDATLVRGGLNPVLSGGGSVLPLPPSGLTGSK